MKECLIISAAILLCCCQGLKSNEVYTKAELKEDLGLKGKYFSGDDKNILRVSYIASLPEDNGGFLINDYLIDSVSKDTIYYKKEFGVKWVFILRGDTSLRDSSLIIGDSTNYYSNVFTKIIRDSPQPPKQ